MDENYFRLIILIIDICPRVLRKFLQDKWQRAGYSSFTDVLDREKHIFYHCLHPGRQHPRDACCCKSNRESRSSMTQPQWDLLYVDSGCSTCRYAGIHPCKYRPRPGVQLEDLDITLLRFIIDKLFRGNTALEQIRKLRNELIHSGTVRVSDAEFRQKWFSARGAILQIANTSAAPFPAEIQQKINELETKSFNTNECKRLRQIVNRLRKTDRLLGGVSDVLAVVNQKVQTIDEKLDVISKLPVRHPDIQRRIENTEDQLNYHKERLYVPLGKAEKAAYERLQTVHFVTISGRAGSGKTSLGKQLMLKYCDQHRGDDGTQTYAPVILSKPEDFDLIKFKDRLVVFIDDPLGKSNIDADSLSNWEKHFENVSSFCTKGNLRIIIGLRSNLISEPEKKFRNFVLFSKENIIDLSLTHKLTSTEKLQFLKAYCRQYRVHIREGNVQQSKQSSTVNIEISDLEIPASKNIQKCVLSDISKLDPFDGFPLACFRFFNIPTFFAQSADFFRHATDSLKNEISELEEKVPELFFTLFLLSLKGGKVDLDNIDEEKLRKLNEAFHENFTTSDIKTCLRNEKSKVYVDRNHGIEYDKRGKKLDMIYQFTHQTVLESVLSLFCDRHPDTLIQLSYCNIIKEFVRPHKYKPSQGEICVNVPSTCHRLLAERVVTERVLPDYKGINDQSFAEEILDAMEKQFSSLWEFPWILFRLVSSIPISAEPNFCKAVCARYKHNGQKLFSKAKLEVIFRSILHFLTMRGKQYIALSTFLFSLNYLLEKRELTFVDEQITSSGLDLSCTYKYMDQLFKRNEMIPICFAAENGLKHLVLYWLNKSGTVCERDTLCLLLDKCCQYDYHDAFYMLIQKNWDGKHRDVLSPGLVYNNASNGVGKQIVEYFLKSDIDKTLTDKSGNTLLHYCSQYGLKSEVLYISNEHPEIVNARNNNGQTVIYFAAMHRQKDIVKELLERGADASIKDDNGYTVLHHCAAYGWVDIIQQLQPTVTILLDAENKHSFSPVHVAVFCGNQRVVEISLNAVMNLQYGRFSCITLGICGMLSRHNTLHSFSFMGQFRMEPTSEKYITFVEYIFQQNKTMVKELYKPLDVNEYTIIHYCILSSLGHMETTFLSHVVTKFPDAARARNKTKLPTALHLAAYLGRYEHFVLLYDAGVRIADDDMSIEDTVGLGIQFPRRTWQSNEANVGDDCLLSKFRLSMSVHFGRTSEYNKIQVFYRNKKLGK